MIILMHSSKTMRAPSGAGRPAGVPVLLGRAVELVTYLRTVPVDQLARIMSLSPDLAARTAQQYAEWSDEPGAQTPAAATFVGDIYSGLRVDSFTAADRRYADTHLRILSGLYGILRPFDGISPYRLEMGTVCRRARTRTSTGSGARRSPSNCRPVARSSTSRPTSTPGPYCRTSPPTGS